MGLPLVGLVHVGMGSFLSMQAYFGATFMDGIGPVTGVGLIRNLAPLLTGLHPGRGGLGPLRGRAGPAETPDRDEPAIGRRGWSRPGWWRRSWPGRCWRSGARWSGSRSAGWSPTDDGADLAGVLRHVPGDALGPRHRRAGRQGGGLRLRGRACSPATKGFEAGTGESTGRPGTDLLGGLPGRLPGRAWRSCSSTAAGSCWSTTPGRPSARRC